MQSRTPGGGAAGTSADQDVLADILFRYVTFLTHGNRGLHFFADLIQLFNCFNHLALPPY